MSWPKLKSRSESLGKIVNDEGISRTIFPANAFLSRSLGRYEKSQVTDTVRRLSNESRETRIQFTDTGQLVTPPLQTHN